MCLSPFWPPKEGSSLPQLPLEDSLPQTKPHDVPVNRGVVRNVMTVDVEDYFHAEAMSRAVPRESWNCMPLRVQQNTERIFDLFASRGVRGTFFFLGWVAERFPALVQKAVRLGHEIGCHSYWHRPVSRLTQSEFREDTARAKGVIEDAGGVAVRGYRAPSFSLVRGTEWAAQTLVDLGFQYDSSVHPIRHDIYGNHSAPRRPFKVAGGRLLEIPIATARIAGNNLPFAGGGYFRAMPYSYVRWGLRRFSRTEGSPAVFYIHPWEIDLSQPRISTGLRSTFRQYIGLSTTWRKLERLCKEFSFVPISEAFHCELDGNSLESERHETEVDSQHPRRGGVRPTKPSVEAVGGGR